MGNGPLRVLRRRLLIALVEPAIKNIVNNAILPLTNVARRKILCVKLCRGIGCKMAPRNKAQKFVDLANKRVNKTIKDLRLVSNLANKKNYQYTEDQARKIVRALQKELDSVKESFQNSRSGQVDEFQL